jgi:hypothetical protein
MDGRLMSASHFTCRSYALGLFILFQLIYLPTANAIKLFALRLPEGKGELDDDIQLRGQSFGEPLQTVADAVGTAFVRYGELTGQAQGWSLFAPVFGHQASLPEVSVDPASAPSLPGQVITSEFAMRTQFELFRLPSSRCRLFNYEYRLALLFWTSDPESYATEIDKWDRAQCQRVQRQNRSFEAFLRWRCSQIFSRTNAVPRGIVVWVELYPNSTSFDSRGVARSSQTFPLAVWWPKEKVPPSKLPVQAITRQKGFVWLPIEEPPP